MRKTLALLVFILFIGCKGFIEKKTYESSFKRLINNIETEYTGIIIETYSTRNDNLHTHYRVLTGIDTLSICPGNSEIMNNIEVGDSILKKTNDNMVYIYKNREDIRKFYYMKIPMEYRKDSRFPEEWKDKWMESSDWDR